MLDYLVETLSSKKGYSTVCDQEYLDILFDNVVIFKIQCVNNVYKLLQYPPDIKKVNEYFTAERITELVLSYLTGSTGVGKKYDSGKLRYDLLPKEVMQDLLEQFRLEGSNLTDLINYNIYFQEHWGKVFYFTTKYLISEFNISLNEAIRELCEIITYGAMKYEPNNWQKVERNRYVAAYLRHYTAHLNEEPNDQESGYHHLAHCMCNAMFLHWKDKYER